MGGDSSKIANDIKKTGETNKLTLESFNKQLGEHSLEIDFLKNSLEGNISEIRNLSSTIDENVGKITAFKGDLGTIINNTNTGFESVFTNLNSLHDGLGGRIDRLETSYGNLPNDISQYANLISNNTSLLNEQKSRLDGIDQRLNDHTLKMTANEIKAMIPLVIQKGAYETIQGMIGTVAEGEDPANATIIDQQPLIKKYVLGSRVVITGVVDFEIPVGQDVVVVFSNPNINDTRIYLYKFNKSDSISSGNGLFTIGDARGFRVSYSGTSGETPRSGFKFVITGVI